MSAKLLTEQHLEFLSLKGGCTGSSESTLVKMPYCWKSHALAQMVNSCNCCEKDGYSKCSKIWNTRCLPKKALTNSADQNQKFLKKFDQGLPCFRALTRILKTRKPKNGIPTVQKNIASFKKLKSPSTKYIGVQDCKSGVSESSTVCQTDQGLPCLLF